jgi:hypothetical protein
MSQTLVSPAGSLVHVGTEGPPRPPLLPEPAATEAHDVEADAPAANTSPLHPLLAEVKGQVQFLLYLTDQIEESLGQLDGEGDESQVSFLCKVLSMYAAQLEVKHKSVGEGLASARKAVQQVIREHESR